MVFGERDLEFSLRRFLGSWPGGRLGVANCVQGAHKGLPSRGVSVDLWFVRTGGTKDLLRIVLSNLPIRIG